LAVIVGLTILNGIVYKNDDGKLVSYIITLYAVLFVYELESVIIMVRRGNLVWYQIIIGSSVIIAGIGLAISLPLACEFITPTITANFAEAGIIAGHVIFKWFELKNGY
jgi:hypothetical protein